MANNRGMGSVSWGQRKALRGIPYGTDPAYLLAQQQMQEEYNLMPERARLAEEKRQRDKAQEEADKNRKAQGMAGVMGAGTQILTADALRGFPGTRGLVGMGKEAYNAATGATSLPYLEAQQIADAGGLIPTSTLAATPGVGIEPGMVSVAPQAIDVSTGLGGGMAGVEGGLAGETAGGGLSSMGAAGPAALAAGAVIAGHQAGNKMGGSEGLAVGTPFSLPTAPQSLLADKTLGESNYLTKNLSAMEAQEKGFYDSLDKLFSGDVGGWAKGTANAVVKPITSILGLDDDIFDDIF
jgi:hypothetical protein